MATWAIGDIQGCFETLRLLLGRISFEPARDRLWLVGDLVNRGPRSLDVLRWARAHDECIVAVLGNHDLHLLGQAFGTRTAKKRDTLGEVLDAPDRAELIDWLRHRPLLHLENGHVLVHAGLLPGWDLETAAEAARLVEETLRGDAAELALRAVANGPVPCWRHELPAAEAWRAALQVLTRMRTCDATGCVDDDYSGPPGGAAPGFRPWFEWPSVRHPDWTVVFGHWAALGLHVQPNWIAIDSGCVWGRELSAVRLDDRKVVQQPFAD